MLNSSLLHYSHKQEFYTYYTEKDSLIRCKLTLFTWAKMTPEYTETAKHPVQVIYFNTMNYKPCPGAFQGSEMMPTINRFFLPDSIMSVNNLLLCTHRQKTPSLHSSSPQMLLICLSVAGSLVQRIIFGLVKS